ncbi:MAG: hypothetical protein ABRQ37_16270 [Candidatus Eremiobacterota bacterium]
MKKYLSKIPFTVCYFCAMAVLALINHSYIDPLSKSWLDRFGFAPCDLWLIRWERLFTSALLTGGSTVFWKIIISLLLITGTGEWIKGTKMTIITFCSIHLVSLISLSLFIALPLHLAGFYTGTELITGRDVGPSAGIYGILGMLCSDLPVKWKWASGITMLTGLIITAFIPGGTTKLTADLIHIIAFPAGWIFAIFYKKQIR